MSQNFAKKREKYSTPQKLLIDEMEVSRGLSYIYEGLYYLSVACEANGLIKPLPYPEVEKCVY